VREVGFDYYTNWALKQGFFDPTSLKAFPIATMNLKERKVLEDIASTTEVFEPNGIWNCQDWVIEVLRKPSRRSGQFPAS